MISVHFRAICFLPSFCEANTRTTIFSAKNKYLSISELNFTKSEGKVRFGQIFFENNPLDEQK